MNKKIALSLILLMNSSFMIAMNESAFAFMNFLYKKQKPIRYGMSSFYYTKGYALSKKEHFETVIKFLHENKEMQLEEKKFIKWCESKESTLYPSFQEEKFPNQHMQPLKSCLKQTSSYSLSSPRSGQTTPEIVSPEGNYYLRK